MGSIMNFKIFKNHQDTDHVRKGNKIQIMLEKAITLTRNIWHKEKGNK